MADRMTPMQPCIVCHDIAISRGGRTIWSEGTFTIPRGSATAIVGTNGAGKTTLMKAELGLIPLSHGTMTVLGKPAGEMNAHIGYVPQSYASDIDSSLTAEQSVLLGLTGTRFGSHIISKKERDKAREAMEFVGVLDKAPYRLSQLSGGLRQRVAIAQALVSDPELLMLDEPSMGLAPILVEQIFEIIRSLHRTGTTILLVEQNAQMALSVADRAYVLETGEITLTGTGDELIHSDDIRKAYLGG